MLIILQAVYVGAWAQEKVKGRVVDAQLNEAIPGAVIKIPEKNITIITDAKGEFELNLAAGKYKATVQSLGYVNKEVEVSVPMLGELVISLTQDPQSLQEVEIVNTGYQSIAKERATGSFTIIDEKTLSRTSSPDILSRLKGVTNSLLFDSSVGNGTGISVRGRSTIFSNTTPLIVVDNFPFEGDINSLNPETIESVTILKDAAAASIWGVRAANGVVVITTKQGKFEKKPVINVKSDFSFSQKPNIYDRPQLTSSEFIDLEKFLFEKGKYTSTINNGYGVISPVIEILNKIKLQPAFAPLGNAEIERLRDLDSRNHLSKYFLRNSLREMYHIDASGGSGNQNYYFSLGFDKNDPHEVNLKNDRITLKANNNFKLFNNKLTISNDLTFSKNKGENSLINGYTPLFPYEEIINENGEALRVLSRGGLRNSFVDNLTNKNLLDWNNYPLDELNGSYSSSVNSTSDMRVNLSANYKILDDLNFALTYQYYSAATKNETYHKKEGFYVRNRVNSLTQVINENELVRIIPYGDIYRPTFITKTANYGRAQINYSKNLIRHRLNVLAGYEVREDLSKSNSLTLFGYKPETATSVFLNQIERYPLFYGTGMTVIGDEPRQFNNINRSLSYYTNASYEYNSKFILSGSLRKDGSNIFGVKANQKIIPLWSAGLAWNLHNESLLNDKFSFLQLRLTIGENGNVNNSLTAYLTASPSLINQFSKLNFYEIINPPNENLRWERVKSLNVGLNARTFNNKISGSIDFYTKQGIDLISTSPIAPQTGLTSYIGNSANTFTKGLDFLVNSHIISKRITWVNEFNLNYVVDKIEEYKAPIGSNKDIVTSSTYNLTPLKGYPINSVYSFPWGGLDGLGNPLGYYQNIESNNYNGILNEIDYTKLVYSGSATPNFFGNIRNTISYKNLELSFNISYKLNYYFRKQALNYAAIIDGNYNQPEYSKRWQNLGDELKTNVPSMVYPNNSNRNDFYQKSSIHILKGDHIRFQDIRLNFTYLPKNKLKNTISQVNFYTYLTNLGILWKANDFGLDPDLPFNYSQPISISIGLKAQF